MEHVTSVAAMRSKADEMRREGKRIGFVPTMGYLHEGHLDLARTLRPLCDCVVVSIFVNPSQFGPGEDLQRYPRDLERDSNLAEDAGCDLLFVPTAEEMYPAGARTWVTVEGLGAVLEGAFRPTHFRGVATVVTMLFNIVKPHMAAFGQKDAQQALIIRRMVRDLHMDVELCIVPTRREADGLAMSSRNTYLSGSERNEALAISRSLRIAREAFAAGEHRVAALRERMTEELTATGALLLDYLAFVDAETLEDVTTIDDRPVLVAIAARIGTTRLIDNTILGEQAFAQ